MKTLFLITVLLIASSSVMAQKRDKQFWLSAIFYAGGATVDTLSSKGKWEANPLLRNSHGEISVPKSIAVDAIPVITAVFLKRAHHSKMATAVLLFSGSAHTGAAIGNTIGWWKQY